MITKNMFIGWCIGAVLSTLLIVAIMAFAWGDHAPMWYIAPDIIVPMIGGFLGAYLGFNYKN